MHVREIFLHNKLEENKIENELRIAMLKTHLMLIGCVESINEARATVNCTTEIQAEREVRFED
jgi:hypothetical protein